jgi:hypothetical protein
MLFFFLVSHVFSMFQQRTGMMRMPVELGKQNDSYFIAIHIEYKIHM